MHYNYMKQRLERMEEMLEKEIGAIVELCDKFKNEYKSIFFEAADENVMQEWEQNHSITILEAYKAWLRFSDGAVIRGTLAHFYGVEGFEIAGYSEEYVIIGDLIGDGERLGFSKDAGKIVRINHGNIREYEDFSLFLNQVIIRMLKDCMPFEKIEKRYERMIQTTRRGMSYEFNKLPVSERKEFLKLLYDTSINTYNDFIDDLRDIAVQDFWTNERNLIKQGECTRDWCPEQIEVIYNIDEKTGNSRIYGGAAMFLDINGETIKKKHGSNYTNEVFEGHQMLSVDEYPEHAGDWRNMQALGRSNQEHLRAHRGNYQNSTCWYYGYEDGKYYRIGK